MSRAMGFPDKQTMLSIPDSPLPGSFLLGKLLTHSESQLVLF